MKNPFIYLLFIFLTAGCATSTTTDAQNSGETGATEQAQDRNQQPKNANLPAAKSIDGNFFTYDQWRASSVVTEDEDRKKQFENRFLEIREDGYFFITDQDDKNVYTGVFRYDQAKDLLKFYPEENEDGFGLSEWKVQYNGTFFVLTGTPTYGDNGLIIMFRRR